MRKRIQATESEMCYTVCLNAFADGNVDSGALAAAGQETSLALGPCGTSVLKKKKKFEIFFTAHCKQSGKYKLAAVQCTGTSFQKAESNAQSTDRRASRPTSQDSF